jgi:hypothetical protein
VRSRRIRTIDTNTAASDPGSVKVSEKRLRAYCPGLYKWSGSRRKQRWARLSIVEHMMYGDSRAAVVVSADPLLVAAYTDELDCVAVLHFASDSPVPQLAVGTRLLTVNTYGAGGEYSADLVVGPRELGRWTRFHPIIADFICSDAAPVECRKSQISEDEWERAMQLGIAYLAQHPGKSRDGAPCWSRMPAHWRGARSLYR